MSLESELKVWDGRSGDVIRTVYERHVHGVGFVSRLAQILFDCRELQAGASRLLKMYCESGKSVPLPVVRQILANVGQLNHWAARLNLLQALQHLRVPVDCVADTRAFLDACLADQTLMVQAWAYTAYRALAVQHPELREAVETMYDEAVQLDLPGLVTERIEMARRAGFER